MDKTLESMKKELERLEEIRDEACWNYSLLNNKIVEYRLNNGLYHHMSELTNYIRKDIDRIVVVIKNEDGKLETDILYGEMYKEDSECYIDGDGHILYHSNSGEIIKYDYYTNKYIHANGYNIVRYDYIGFMDLEFGQYPMIDNIW